MTHAGCSLKLILDWAWDHVVDIKDQLDQLCKNSEFPFYQEKLGKLSRFFVVYPYAICLKKKFILSCLNQVIHVGNF